MIEHLIIGNSGGIGAAVEERLKALYGADSVAGLSRTAGDFDYADATSLATAAKRFEPNSLKTLFVATGMLSAGDSLPEKSYRHVDADDMAASFLANSIGPALVAQHFMGLMHRRAPAHMAFLSARVGSISDNRLGGWYSYRASKAALNQIIKCLSIEAVRRYPALAIVGLHPGTVDTGLSKPFQGNVPEGKLFTPAQSASYLVEVLKGLDIQHSGRCYDWAGTEVPA